MNDHLAQVACIAIVASALFARTTLHYRRRRWRAQPEIVDLPAEAMPNGMKELIEGWQGRLEHAEFRQVAALRTRGLFSYPGFVATSQNADWFAAIYARPYTPVVFTMIYDLGTPRVAVSVLRSDGVWINDYFYAEDRHDQCVVRILQSHKDVWADEYNAPWESQDWNAWFRGFLHRTFQRWIVRKQVVPVRGGQSFRPTYRLAVQQTAAHYRQLFSFTKTATEEHRGFEVLRPEQSSSDESPR